MSGLRAASEVLKQKNEKQLSLEPQEPSHRYVSFADWKAAGLPNNFNLFMDWIISGPVELPKAKKP